MNIKLYQVDAFTDRLFSGNPAAVCPLEKWVPDDMLQNIAAENNLAETAFIVKQENGFQIRWFTPTVEVDLCGHATLAAAHILFNYYMLSATEISFHSRSGLLYVRKNDDLLTLDFPADETERTEIQPALVDALGTVPVEIYKGKTDFMLVYNSQSEIESVVPDFHKMAGVTARGIIITSPGISSDFVSRFFAPQSGIDEDPVTGSAHTTLTPYWVKKIGKNPLTAVQLSKRKGYLHCKLKGERVEITGKAVLYFEGGISI